MSNQENKFSERIKRPQTLAGALGGLMKILGVRASDSDLVARWPEIAGPEIAALAQICAVRKNRNNKYNIVLRPINPAFALQLSYQTEQIKQQINKYFGYDAVEKISFRR
ncbi:MAG: DUF721 domain-containing protein [Alphaproteobacteria bacterium]|nr:DUF721 domain-containing protein [Alphaproteobacteria bacterium]